MGVAKIVVVDNQVYFGEELSNQLRSYQRKILKWMVLEGLRRRRKGFDDRLYVYMIRENMKIHEKTLLSVLGKLIKKGLIERVARGLYKVRGDVVYVCDEGRFLEDVQPELF